MNTDTLNIPIIDYVINQLISAVSYGRTKRVKTAYRRKVSILQYSYLVYNHLKFVLMHLCLNKKNSFKSPQDDLDEFGFTLYKNISKSVLHTHQQQKQINTY